MDINKDYYTILGVDKNSEESEIKKAYRKKANETHPDKHGGDDSEFKKINEAYQVLGNKDKKLEYDTKSPHGKSYNPSAGFDSFFNAFGGPSGGFNFHFGDAFGGGGDPFESFFRRRRPDFYEELDITLNVTIDLKDIYQNNDMSIKYKRNVTCKDCDGTGFDKSSESHSCEVCDGTGKQWIPTAGYAKCKYCSGTGRIHTGTCKTCNGEKVKEKTEEFQLNNIYRLVNSETKYIQGYGHHSRYYRNKKGNLILNIIVRNETPFERMRDGSLQRKIDLHYEDAINGKEFEFDHLDGKKYKLRIPPKTKDGEVLKMRNKGMLADKEIRQNLFFIINIIIDYSRI
jgi:molecular chaperone DnaJ